jgi:hypothetical protein
MAEKQATEEVQRRRTRLYRFGLLLLVALIPVLVLWLVLLAVIYVLWALLLRFLVLVLWVPRGYQVLVIYSNSPHWKQYFEDRVLPRLGSRCVVLNWSERRRWPLSLARSLFRFYGGHEAYNPLVVVMRPFGRARVFRFWPAFSDAKRGRPEPLQRLETELFNVVQAN